MTPREFLIELCEKKQELLLGISYFTDDDRAELENWWDGAACSVVAEDIKTQIPVVLDYMTCPWCVRGMLFSFDNSTNCDVCEYGARHGICSSEHSTYHTILNTMQSSMSRLASFKPILVWIDNVKLEEEEHE